MKINNVKYFVRNFGPAHHATMVWHRPKRKILWSSSLFGWRCHM